MAFTADELAALGQFISSEVGKAVDAIRGDLETRPQTTQERASVVGVPDVAPDAGPEYWIHLADGTVMVSHDSASTHMPGADGTPVPVIGRYQKGE